MTQQREIGWWLPEPKEKYGDDDPQKAKRATRMRAIAVWFIRLAVFSGVCFTGLLYSEADVSVMGAIFAGALWACGAVIIVGVFIVLIWTM